MKSDKKMFILVEAALFVTALIFITAMLREKNGKDMEKVSVIIENPNDNQWAAFKYGLKMAAEDKKLEMAIVSTEDMLTVEEEKTLIEKEISYGADAVIVQAVPGSDRMEMLRKIQKKIPVVLVGADDENEEGVSNIPVVRPDNYEMGFVLAEELLKDYSGKLDGKKIGILSGEQESGALTQRERGFCEGLRETGAAVSWSVACSWEEENPLETMPWVDFVVALDDRGLVTAGKSSAANNLHGALLYGIGNSTEAVYYLDTGYVECLVIPDEFNVGYQALTLAAERVQNPVHKLRSRMVSHKVIRRDALFSEENQELIFTLSQ